MSIQAELLKTAAGAAAAIGNITESFDKEDDVMTKAEKESGSLAIRGKKEKQPLQQQLEEANKRAEDALATAQLQRHQAARVKGLYGARVKAMKKEIAELKGGKE